MDEIIVNDKLNELDDKLLIYYAGNSLASKEVPSW